MADDQPDNHPQSRLSPAHEINFRQSAHNAEYQGQRPCAHHEYLLHNMLLCLNRNHDQSCKVIPILRPVRPAGPPLPELSTPPDMATATRVSAGAFVKPSEFTSVVCLFIELDISEIFLYALASCILIIVRNLYCRTNPASSIVIGIPDDRWRSIRAVQAYPFHHQTANQRGHNLHRKSKHGRLHRTNAPTGPFRPMLSRPTSIRLEPFSTFSVCSLPSVLTISLLA